MASTKLIQLYIHVILLQVKFTRNINHCYLIFCLNSLTECPSFALTRYQVSASLLLKKLLLLKKFIAKLTN